MPFLPTGQGILIILYLLHTQYTLTFIVPVVYIARDVMILMRANIFRGPLEGVGLENRAFFGPEMAASEASAILAQ
jgi:hypothetical protein